MTFFCCLAWTGNSAGSKQIILNFFGREVNILNILKVCIINIFSVLHVMMIGNMKGTKEAGLTIGDWLCNEELPCERSGYFTKQLPQIFSVFFLCVV